MAEQSTYIATSLPVDGQFVFSNQVTTDLNGLINEFNKQVPLTKISAEQAWLIFGTTITGFTGTPTQTFRYQKVGRLITAYIAISGTSNATTFTLTLPVAAQSGGNYAANSRVTDSGTVSNSLGVLVLSAGATTVSVFKSLDGTGWTNSGAKALECVLVYESLT